MLLNGIDAGVKTGGDFSPIPMDKYTLQLMSITPVQQFNKFKNEDQAMLNFQFVVLDGKEMEDGAKTRGKYLWKRCSLSYNSKSWLFKILAGMLGREMTKEEQDKYDLSALVGMQVSAMVDQKPSADGQAIYNNILTFSKVTKKLPSWEMASEASTTVTSKSVSVDDIAAGIEAEKVFGAKAQ
jgi:hypothetical protein